MSPNASSPLKSLRDFAVQLPNGPIAADKRSQLLGLLIEVWPNLTGSSEQKMNVRKLLDREIEGLYWEYPNVLLKIERHGAFVLGSTRAAIHTWQVNVEVGTAEIIHENRRQLVPMSSRLDVKGIAAKISKIIIKRGKSSKLKWLNEQKTLVRVISIGDLVPADNKMTMASRRKRFRAALEETLNEHGWKPVPGGGFYVYQHGDAGKD